MFADETIPDLCYVGAFNSKHRVTKNYKKFILNEMCRLTEVEGSQQNIVKGKCIAVKTHVVLQNHSHMCKKGYTLHNHRSCMYRV